MTATSFRPTDFLAAEAATIVQEIGRTSEKIGEDNSEEGILSISDTENDDVMDGIVNLFLSQLSVRASPNCSPSSTNPTRMNSDSALCIKDSDSHSLLNKSTLSSSVITEVIHKESPMKKVNKNKSMNVKSSPTRSPKNPSSPRSTNSSSRTPPNSPRNQAKSPDDKAPSKRPTISPKGKDKSPKTTSSPRPSSEVYDTLPKEEILEKSIPEEMKLTTEQSTTDESSICTRIKQEVPDSLPDVKNDSVGDQPTDEIFRDPSTFDFLSAIKSCNTGIDLRKNSLYMKFDPLVGAVSDSDAGSKSSVFNTDFESRLNIESSGDTVKQSYDSKALAIIDNLISFSESQPRSHDYQHGMPEPCEGLKNISYILQELKTMKDLHTQENNSLRTQLASVLAEYEISKKEIDRKTKLAVQADEEIMMMREVMDEYEKTIRRLVCEKEEMEAAHKMKVDALEDEMKRITEHLKVSEISFNDLYKKYETTKKVIEDMKENENLLKAQLNKYEEEIIKNEEKYQILKQHAMDELSNANRVIEAAKREHLIEKTKLEAMLRKAELTSSTLEETLEQKKKESQELVSICEDLISKVGK
ncbi:transforming acidic coiled-coil-containing protein 3 [Anabrus simplex]|uniref:transforming acidic coiled-coil-containing protein 3 n=1 Tax=Anabrus simplex TaxID=316456 RepID=UPI0035A2BCDF